jgi:hypothetical protein
LIEEFAEMVRGSPELLALYEKEQASANGC